MSAELDGSGKPPAVFEQEVRFAVVMYGGSSLAIYKEPWSVLNSRRMHLKLLEALRGMDGPPTRPTDEEEEEQQQARTPVQSPLVDELDLYVTATDISGRALQLRLADKVVSEYRHRNVFQFRYRSQRACGATRAAESGRAASPPREAGHTSAPDPRAKACRRVATSPTVMSRVKRAEAHM